MDPYRASLKPALSVRNFASFCAIDFSNGLNLGIKNLIEELHILSIYLDIVKSSKDTAR